MDYAFEHKYFVIMLKPKSVQESSRHLSLGKDIVRDIFQIFLMKKRIVQMAINKDDYDSMSGGHNLLNTERENKCQDVKILK